MEHMEMFLIINVFNVRITYTKIIVFYNVQIIQIFNKLIPNFIVLSAHKENVMIGQYSRFKHP